MATTRRVPKRADGRPATRVTQTFLLNAERRSQGFLTAYRGSLAADPEVRAIVEEGRDRQTTRILTVVAGRSHPPLLRMTVSGWIALVQHVTAQWLQEGHTERGQVVEMLLGALGGAIGAAAQADPQVEGVLVEWPDR